jgi:DNA-binding NarL/FixJ family response regulator
MPKLRILLADDHETVREGLKAIVNSQPDMNVIGEAGDGKTAVQFAIAMKPDVVLIDVSMPQLNGLQATEAIKTQCPAVKVLALTRYSDAGYIRELIAAGASGYVLKQSRSTELLQAIRAVAIGSTYLDPTAAAKLAAHMSRHKRVRIPEKPQSVLSQREEEVLRLVAWGHSNKEIAKDLEVSVKTVETHKTNAMQKLGFTSRTDVVKFALVQGWLNEGGTPQGKP